MRLSVCSEARGGRMLALVAATFAGISTPIFQSAMKRFGWGRVDGSRGDVSAAAASSRRSLRTTAAGNQQQQDEDGEDQSQRREGP